LTSKPTRRFVYHYNGNDSLQDFEDDVTGAIEMPAVGSVINRNGRDWTVLHVVAPVSFQGTIPLVRVFLSDRKPQVLKVKHLPR
jgi:hypothetical protein